VRNRIACRHLKPVGCVAGPPARAVHYHGGVKALAFSLLVLAACGRDYGQIDKFIGAACTRDADCDDRCYVNSNTFPGGFCSVACSSNNDCPGDAVCVDKAGGVCLFLCTELNCNDLGPGWQCRDEDTLGGSGKFNVCIGD